MERKRKERRVGAVVKLLIARSMLALYYSPSRLRLEGIKHSCVSTRTHREPDTGRQRMDWSEHSCSSPKWDGHTCNYASKDEHFVTEADTCNRAETDRPSRSHQESRHPGHVSIRTTPFSSLMNNAKKDTAGANISFFKQTTINTNLSLLISAG